MDDSCLPVYDDSQGYEGSSSLLSPLASCWARLGLLVALGLTALLLLTAQLTNPSSSSTRAAGGGSDAVSSASLVFAPPDVVTALLSSLRPSVQSVAAFPAQRSIPATDSQRRPRSDREAGEVAEAAIELDDDEDDVALDEDDDDDGVDLDTALDEEEADVSDDEVVDGQTPEAADEETAEAEPAAGERPQRQQQQKLAAKCDSTAGLLYVLPFLPLLPPASVQPCTAFAAIPAALAEARKLRAAKPDSAISVLLYPTLHFQSETLLLTEQDSGRPGAPLVIAAMPDAAALFFRQLRDEWKAAQGKADGKAADAAVLAAWRADSSQPVISGGVELREWTSSDGGVWSHAAPSARLPVSQLFCGGLRANRSRLPASGFYNYRFAQQGQKTRMTVDPAELSGISNLQDAEWIVYHSWTTSRHLYKSHNAQTGELETANPTMWDFGFKQGQATRYHVENAKEGMQAAGDFYFSEKERRVYYRPHAGVDPNTQADCITPVLETVVEVRGQQADSQRAAYIELRDISVQHSAWSMTRGPSYDYQATAWIQLSAVHTLYAREVEYRRLLISHAGGYGWWCEKGCTAVRLLDSIVTDTASGGVRVGLDREMKEANVPQPHDVLNGVVVENNEIFSIGHVFADGVGALLHRTQNTVLKDNHIHHTYYSGVSAGWECQMRGQRCRRRASTAASARSAAVS